MPNGHVNHPVLHLAGLSTTNMASTTFVRRALARSLCRPTSFSLGRPLHVSSIRSVPSDPYPLPLSPELEKQRAAPHGSVESSTSSALNTETEEDWPMPQPLDRTGEDEATIRARLVYQTRKRGMLEGDLLLSTFARDNLGSMTLQELQEFDKVRSFRETLRDMPPSTTPTKWKH